MNVLKNDDLNNGYSTDDDSTASGSSASVSSTGRPSRRVRKNTVDYSELNIDNDGNEASSSNGKKWKQSKSSKSSKKRKSSTSTTASMTTDSSDGNSSDTSDFTIELSGDDDSDDDSIFGESDDEDSSKGNKNKVQKAPSRKASRKTNSIPWNEIPLEVDGLVSRVDQADHERMVRYRQAAERVKKWLDTVDELDLPANPLDRLLNELGGPDEVAELTGRKTRQVQSYDALQDKHVVIYEKRKGDGPMDQINIEEKNHFQNGTKKIAILSEAASTGISLQADKRVKNQRR